MGKCAHLNVTFESCIKTYGGGEIGGATYEVALQ